MASWMPDEGVIQGQLAICGRYGARHLPPRHDLKLGINLAGDPYPINGFREPADSRHDELSGWWIWNGERSIPQRDADFFDGMHLWHLPERCRDVLPYLGLPPGWRFLIAPGYEDVWYDEALLLPAG